jgi:hypothetical protein
MMDTHMDKPRFHNDINLGQAITAATFGMSLLAIVWHQSSFQAVTTKRLDVAEAINAQYTPIVQGMSTVQNVTNERLEGVSRALAEVRGAISVNAAETSKMAQRLSRIEALLPEPQQRLGLAQ